MGRARGWGLAIDSYLSGAADASATNNQENRPRRRHLKSSHKTAQDSTLDIGDIKRRRSHSLATTVATKDSENPPTFSSHSEPSTSPIKSTASRKSSELRSLQYHRNRWPVIGSALQHLDSLPSHQTSFCSSNSASSPEDSFKEKAEIRPVHRKKTVEISARKAVVRRSSHGDTLTTSPLTSLLTRNSGAVETASSGCLSPATPETPSPTTTALATPPSSSSPSIHSFPLQEAPDSWMAPVDMLRQNGDAHIRDIDELGLRTLMNSKVPLTYFLSYAIERYSCENVLFMIEVNTFEAEFFENVCFTWASCFARARAIYDSYIAPNAPLELNLSNAQRSRLEDAWKTHQYRKCFALAKAAIYATLERNYGQFRGTPYYQLLRKCKLHNGGYSSSTRKTAVRQLLDALSRRYPHVELPAGVSPLPSPSTTPNSSPKLPIGRKPARKASLKHINMSHSPASTPGSSPDISLRPLASAGAGTGVPQGMPMGIPNFPAEPVQPKEAAPTTTLGLGLQPTFDKDMMIGEGLMAITAVREKVFTFIQRSFPHTANVDTEFSGAQSSSPNTSAPQISPNSGSSQVSGSGNNINDKERREREPSRDFDMEKESRWRNWIPKKLWGSNAEFVEVQGRRPSG